MLKSYNIYASKNKKISKNASKSRNKASSFPESKNKGKMKIILANATFILPSASLITHLNVLVNI